MGRGLWFRDNMGPFWVRPRKVAEPTGCHGVECLPGSVPRDSSIPSFLGRIRGTLKREPLLNPLLAILNRDLI